MPRGSTLPPEIQAEILRLGRETDLSARAIARQLGLSKNSADDILKRAGLTRPRGGPKKKQPEPKKQSEPKKQRPTSAPIGKRRMSEKEIEEARTFVVRTRCAFCQWFKDAPLAEGREALLGHRANGCGRKLRAPRSRPPSAEPSERRLQEAKTTKLRKSGLVYGTTF